MPWREAQVMALTRRSFLLRAGAALGAASYQISTKPAMERGDGMRSPGSSTASALHATPGRARAGLFQPARP